MPAEPSKDARVRYYALKDLHTVLRRVPISEVGYWDEIWRGRWEPAAHMVKYGWENDYGAGEIGEEEAMRRIALWPHGPG